MQKIYSASDARVKPRIGAIERNLHTEIKKGLEKCALSGVSALLKKDFIGRVLRGVNLLEEFERPWHRAVLKRGFSIASKSDCVLARCSKSGNFSFAIAEFGLTDGAGSSYGFVWRGNSVFSPYWMREISILHRLWRRAAEVAKEYEKNLRSR